MAHENIKVPPVDFAVNPLTAQFFAHASGDLSHYSFLITGVFGGRRSVGADAALAGNDGAFPSRRIWIAI